MNPVAHADGLKLNITDSDNALDLELAREVAAVFRVSDSQVNKIIKHFQDAIGQWPTLAGALKISRQEQDRMAPVFDCLNR